ncbi:MAG: type I toxin-antitoxin system SymE family toxin [Bacteroidales bacterium]|jgi:toxic protein SymE|nr:type I toxin-antitoxin system SymE family toxin [Bacteroidales bacterium]
MNPKEVQKSRVITIYDHYSPRKWEEVKVPYIRLRGKWLENIGYHIGEQIQINITDDNTMVIKKLHNPNDK